MGGWVVGQTGRNFAAGMSGGIAYVYDDQGDFPTRRCNTASVDLEALELAEDVAVVQSLLVKHRDLTGSPRAAWILENWEEVQPKFIKVFPQEYKRVLGERAKEEKAAQAVSAQTEVRHG